MQTCVIDELLEDKVVTTILLYKKSMHLVNLFGLLWYVCPSVGFPRCLGFGFFPTFFFVFSVSFNLPVLCIHEKILRLLRHFQKFYVLVQ